MVDPSAITRLLGDIRGARSVRVAGSIPLSHSDEATDLLFRKGQFLAGHPNALRFVAEYGDGHRNERTYFSVGGGAIREDGAAPRSRSNVAVRYPFGSAAELLELGKAHDLSIAEIVWANQEAWRSQAETRTFVDAVRQAMLDCIDAGGRHDGILPGGLEVRRRAKALREALQARGPELERSHVFEWVSLYALSVNEENAAGGRVVTAPTNGAAGILPAVMKYYEVFAPAPTFQGDAQLMA